jgi:hypothetical protein
MLLMLIDTRRFPPEPEGDDEPDAEPWPRIVARLLCTWPAAITFLLVTASLVHGIAGVVIAFLAAALALRWFMRLWPTVGGMRDWHQ